MTGSKASASIFLLVILCGLTFAVEGRAQHATSPVTDKSLFFTENAGQWDDQIKFRAGTAEATAWFADDGPYYQFSREIATEGNSKPRNRLLQESPAYECLMIKTSFVGVGTSLGIFGEEEVDYKCNYFLGNDPSRWQTNVPSYSSIIYRNIYSGVDLRYYGNGSYMEYDFMVAAGSDPSQIEIRYDGIEGLSVNAAGELEVSTLWGTIVESCPYIYQIDGEDQIVLSGTYEIISDNSFGFAVDVEQYNSNLPLIIDPVLIYSSYLGGWAGDFGWGIEIDSTGDMYLSGQTTSSSFPVVFPYQDAFAGATDVFVTKMGLDGTLEFSTFFGGIGQEEYPRLATDNEYNVYVSGRTYSEDFPVYAAYSSSLNGNSDVFAFKMNSTGDVLLFSTFLGGNSDDFAGGLAVDNNGNLYVATTTVSKDFPVVNAYQAYPGENPASENPTVTKFSVGGDYLEYSTYIAGTDEDVVMGMAVDANGCAMIHGFAYSDDFPLYNAYDSQLEGCDAFLSKLTSDGSGLVFSTFLGGSENEWIESVDIDEAGNIYAAGGTRSLDFPLVNPYQTEMLGGTTVGIDNFVSKFNSVGSELIYSTYLGGTGDDFTETIHVDNVGIAFITGYTYSADFPLENPIYATLSGTNDANLTALSPGGNELSFSTYLGGTDAESGYDIAIDDLRNVYVTGYTRSPDFPLVNEYQNTLKSAYDAFVSVFEIGCCVGNTGNADYDPGDATNILDCVYYIDWLYKQGPAPPCETEADMDGDGQPGTGDLILLIDYLWFGGQPPVTCP